MLSFSLCKPISQGWSPIAELPVNKGFYPAGMNLDISSAYSFDLQVDLNIGVENWNLLKDDFDDIGLIVSTNDLDLPFVKARQPQIDRTKGVIKLGFSSASWKLKFNQMIQQNRLYSGSLKSFISGISDDFSWLFISEDKEVDIEVTGADNFELLKNVCNSNRWSFRDNGIEGGKPEILVGNFKDIATYFDTTKDDKYRTYKATNDSTFLNEFDKENTQVILENVKFNYSGDLITDLETFVDSGSGLAENSAEPLDSVPKSELVDGFPIITETITRNDNTTAIKYYVQNTNVKNKLLERRFEYRTFSSTTNAEDIDTGADFDIEKAKINAYKDSVARLKQVQERIRPSFDFDLPRLILPGNRLEIDYYESVPLLGEKEAKEVFNFQESLMLRDLKYNVDDFIKFINN